MLWATLKLLSGFALCCSLSAAEYPLPRDLGPTNTYGSALQRSMRLAAESPPQKKRTVKVLFYGQSITQEIWSVWLANHLRESFPNANLVITNLAIGYTSDLLSKPATIDIPGFYPDLMIFQDYGSMMFIEDMIALTRRQTIADILIQNDHVHFPQDMDEPTDPEGGTLPERAYRNYVALPDLAHRYGAELGQVRDYWKRYLRDFGLQTTNLLRDNVHPNRHGCFLMNELLKPYFHSNLSFDSAEWEEAEKNYRIGQDVHWTNGTLSLEFTGNRVDVVVEHSGTEPVEVWIDGRKPSAFPELYQFTRTDWYPKTWWLTVLKITSLVPLVDEDWTATITEFNTDGALPFARFEVTGSRTGYDGEGNIKERFVSNSGRVVIEPADWWMLYWAAPYFGDRLQPLPVGHEIRWKSIFNGTDLFVPKVDDSTLETTVTLAQGLANGRHRLVLKSVEPSLISGIRVYNPLARKQPFQGFSPEITKIRAEDGSLRLGVRSAGRYVIESSDDCATWRAVSAPLSSREPGVDLPSTRRFFRIRAID